LATAQTGQDLKSRVDAEDIVQSVFRTFFRRAQEGHYEVPDGEEIWKLFLVIGLHKIRDAAVFHRAARRNAGRTTALVGAGESVDPPAADQMAATTLRMVIDEILLNLNDSQKEIVTMRMEGAQVDEIAQATKRSHRTVERTLQKFRELLQKQIQEEPRSRSEQE
jgi:RNA polymerase sigma-70 factor (ECF subfamily)